MEAEIVCKPRNAKGDEQHQKPGLKGLEGSSPRASRRSHPADTLTLDFGPLEPRENTFVWPQIIETTDMGAGGLV